MNVLTKDQILAAEDLGKELVSVPEWGGHVYVKVMSGAERDAWEASIVGTTGSQRNLQNIRARLVALTACDGGGLRLFSDADVGELGKKSSKALDRVFAVAQKLNALTEDDIKELEGN